MTYRCTLLVVVLGLLASALSGQTQDPAPAMPPRPLPDGPLTFDTAEHTQIRVSVIKGLSHPWSLVFLPNGDMLVTERPGQLRVVRDGVVDPQPITGVPKVDSRGFGGLMDIALHPRFVDTRWVYLSFMKSVGDADTHTSALARGRLEGGALVDVRELFVADAVGTGPAAGNAMVFGPDGHLYMTVGRAVDDIAQDPSSILARSSVCAMTAVFPRTTPSLAAQATSSRSTRSGIGTCWG